jgi:hypothetical protein
MTIQELKNEIIVSLEKFNEDNNCSISEIEQFLKLSYLLIEITLLLSISTYHSK